MRGKDLDFSTEPWFTSESFAVVVGTISELTGGMDMLGSGEVRLHRGWRSNAMRSISLVIVGLVAVVGLSMTAAVAEPVALSVTPAVVEVGGSVTLKAVGLPAAANRVDFSVGGIPAGSAPAVGGTAQLVTRAWDAGTKTVEGRVVTYVNGVEQVVVLTSSLQVGAIATTAPVTTAPGTTSPGTTSPGTTSPPSSQPVTTIAAGSGELTVQPAALALREFATLTVVGLKPADGVVDFAANGSPIGSVSVTPAGAASTRVQFWETGTQKIVATWRHYVAGVLTSQTFTGEVIVGASGTTTLPGTTLPGTTLPGTTLPVTTVPVTTVPVTTVPVTTLPPPSSGRGPIVLGRGRVGETLTCGGILIGLAPPAIQWFDDQGQPIAGATGRTFVVRDQDSKRAVSCVSTSGGLSTGSQPMIITNLDGPLPSATVAAQRTNGVDLVSYTCEAQTTNSVVLESRFIKFIQQFKGGPSLPVFAEGVLMPSEAGIGMSCNVFLKNDLGAIEIVTFLNTDRVLVASVQASGRARVGRTLTCTPSKYSPSLLLLGVEWTLDSQPYALGAVRTTLGSSPYVVTSADLGKQIRCRARFAAQTPPFSQGAPVEQWDYSAPLTVTN